MRREVDAGLVRGERPLPGHELRLALREEVLGLLQELLRLLADADLDLFLVGSRLAVVDDAAQAPLGASGLGQLLQPGMDISLAHVPSPSAGKAAELTGQRPENADPRENPSAGGGTASLAGSILSSARPRGFIQQWSEGRDRVTRRSDQRGQSLVLVVISLTVLLGMAALVLDLGLGWYAKRQLQASVDAAALAGAQELPSSANAVARAHEYILKNPTRGVDGVQDTIVTKCLASAPGCAPVNAVQVSAKGNADTAFARIFGINSMTVGAKATACQPCGAKPLDIMVVLDRTGSMLQGGTPNKLENAKTGIMTFLNFLDAGTALVGLTVLPPSPQPRRPLLGPAPTTWRSLRSTRSCRCRTTSRSTASSTTARTWCRRSTAGPRPARRTTRSRSRRRRPS